LWEYVLGGASIFGLIVALGAWVNGRLTRGEISRLIEKEHQATRELIGKMDERMVKMDERFAKMSERFAKTDERFAKMDERFEMLLKAIEAHTVTSNRQHKQILEKL
jgi:Zn-finger nucleic acid-binding protein